MKEEGKYLQRLLALLADERHNSTDQPLQPSKWVTTLCRAVNRARAQILGEMKRCSSPSLSCAHLLCSSSLPAKKACEYYNGFRATTSHSYVEDFTFQPWFTRPLVQRPPISQRCLVIRSTHFTGISSLMLFAPDPYSATSLVNMRLTAFGKYSIVYPLPSGAKFLLVE